MEDTPRRFSELSTISKVLLGIVIFGGIFAYDGPLSNGLGMIIGSMVVAGIITLFAMVIDLIFSRRFYLNLNVWAVTTFIVFMLTLGSAGIIQ